MASMNATSKDEIWADGMTFITYMKYEEVKDWENTFNTTAEKWIEAIVMKNLRQKNGTFSSRN